VLAGTAETLHGWDLGEPELMALELSLKLYHAREVHPSYQQSIAEAPP
jgi:hypothetical protein